ncbi:MAG: polyphenol oxidase family protein [Actinomycetota bacterium]
MPVHAWTDRADGDLSGSLTLVPAAVVPRAPRPWSWLEQVHGTEVVVVTRPGDHAGLTADAAVTAEPGCTLVARAADCALVVLVGEGAIGVVHAGWRGLLDGVVEAAVTALRGLSAGPVGAHLGPCIHPCCYEFEGPGRAELVARVGPEAEGTTTWGTPALDLPAAVESELERLGVSLAERSPGCTACGDRWWSHRARQEPQRIAAVAWLERP